MKEYLLCTQHRLKMTFFRANLVAIFEATKDTKDRIARNEFKGELYNTFSRKRRNETHLSIVVLNTGYSNVTTLFNVLFTAIKLINKIR